MRRIWIALAVLAAVRVAIPLAELAHADLPGLPEYRRHGLSGDATGFYAATREFLAAWGRLPRIGLALLALFTLAFCVWLVREWTRRPERRVWLIPLAAFVFGLVACADVAEQNASGAAVFGWPLVWALALLPARAIGHLDQNVAFWIGLPLQLAFNVVTLVAIFFAGLYATGRRSVGLVAAAVWAFWPFLSGAIAGHSAWENGQWAVDAGLHMYTEPLSTALCATALALLLSPRLAGMRLALAGTALSFATLVKLSNGVTAGIALALLAWRFRGERRRVLPYVAGVMSLAPLVLVYWPISYPKLFDNPQSWPQKPFELSYFTRSWSDSLIFDPHTLAVVLPLAAVGCFAVRRPWPLALVAVWTLVNPIFYSFYANTPQHPRFLYASLPSFFVLWSAGAVAVLRVVTATRASPRTSSA
ncbi:MAG: hypothetical protein E6G08_19800 [Actinobacteria bacterium]|nr:MAG: hypothetical protein E6G08_19800 [Actinomycetota bacterium]